MSGYLVHGAVDMPFESALRIEDGAGMQIHVHEGQLWITQLGDERDHVVGAGGTFRIERGGATVVYALRSTRAALSAPMPSNYARRITLTIAGVAPRILHDAAAARNSWLGSLRYRFRFLEKRST